MSLGVDPKYEAYYLARAVDERQVGPSNVPGVWVNYRCKNCKYMADRKETQA